MPAAKVTSSPASGADSSAASFCGSFASPPRIRREAAQGLGEPGEGADQADEHGDRHQVATQVGLAAFSGCAGVGERVAIGCAAGLGDLGEASATPLHELPVGRALGETDELALDAAARTPQAQQAERGERSQRGERDRAEGGATAGERAERAERLHDGDEANRATEDPASV